MGVGHVGGSKSSHGTKKASPAKKTNHKSTKAAINTGARKTGTGNGVNHTNHPSTSIHTQSTSVNNGKSVSIHDSNAKINSKSDAVSTSIRNIFNKTSETVTKMTNNGLAEALSGNNVEKNLSSFLNSETNISEEKEHDTQFENKEKEHFFVDTLGMDPKTWQNDVKEGNANYQKAIEKYINSIDKDTVKMADDSVKDALPDEKEKEIETTKITNENGEEITITHDDYRYYGDDGKEYQFKDGEYTAITSPWKEGEDGLRYIAEVDDKTTRSYYVKDGEASGMSTTTQNDDGTKTSVLVYKDGTVYTDVTDENNRYVSKTVESPDGKKVTTQYDEHVRSSEITTEYPNGDKKIEKISYDENGKKTSEIQRCDKDGNKIDLCQGEESVKNTDKKDKDKTKKSGSGTNNVTTIRDLELDKLTYDELRSFYIQNPQIELAQYYIDKSSDAKFGNTFEAYLYDNKIDIQNATEEQIKKEYNKYVQSMKNPDGDSDLGVTRNYYDFNNDGIEDRLDIVENGKVNSSYYYQSDKANGIETTSWDENGDGKIDSVAYFKTDQKGNRVDAKYDYNNDGKIDEVIHSEIDENGNMIGRYTDSNNDGIYDLYDSFENGRLVSSKKISKEYR